MFPIFEFHPPDRGGYVQSRWICPVAAGARGPLPPRIEGGTRPRGFGEPIRRRVGAPSRRMMAVQPRSVPPVCFSTAATTFCATAPISFSVTVASTRLSVSWLDQQDVGEGKEVAL